MKNLVSAEYISINKNKINISEILMKLHKPVIFISGILGLLILFTDSFTLAGNNYVLYSASALMALSAILIYKNIGNKMGKYGVAIIAAVYIAAVILFHSDIFAGIRLIAVTVNPQLEFSAGIQSFEESRFALTIAMLSIMMPIAFYLGYTYLCKSASLLSMIVILPCAELCLYYSEECSGIGLLILLIFTISSVILDLSLNSFKVRFIQGKSEIIGYAASAGNMLIIFMSAVLILINIIIPKDLYNSKLSGLINRDKISQIISSLPLSGSVQDYSLENPSMGCVSGGDLKRASEFEFYGETALSVTVSEKFDTIYLKGYCGAYYENNSWQDLPKEYADMYEKIADSYEANAYEYQLISLDEQYNANIFNGKIADISVEAVSADKKYAYLPYYCKPDDGAYIQSISDAYMTADTNVYDADFYSIVNYDNNMFDYDKQSLFAALLNSIDASELEKLYESESEYAEFVHKAYTALPDSGLERLKGEFGGIAENYDSALQLIKAVYGKISASAAYSLTPGEIPDGSDFAEYFLYENRQGYSVHFATAAVLAFRAAGIPARYAEGYVITAEHFEDAQLSDDGEYILNVTDENAHAWVELYLDGFGWIPVEMTPKYSNLGINDDKFGNMLDVEFEGTMAGNRELPEVSETAYIDAESEIYTDADKTEAESKSKDVDAASEKISQEPQLHAYYYIIIAFVILITIVLSIFLRYRINKIRREKSFKSGDTHERIRNIYNYYIKLCECLGLSAKGFISHIKLAERLGISGLENMVEIVYKSVYGGRNIPVDDVNTALQAVNEFADAQLKNLKIAKKIYLRYISCII